MRSLTLSELFQAAAAALGPMPVERVAAVLVLLVLVPLLLRRAWQVAPGLALPRLPLPRAAALRRAPRAGRSRSQQARALAGQGLQPGEIARQTGLARDAVVFALRLEPAAAERPNLPPPERIAAPDAEPAARPLGLSFQQVLARQRFGSAA